MATLNLGDFSTTRQNAVKDAKEMQASVLQDCAESGKEPPPYFLLELIGKGSFGRVYKARGTKPGQLVAVKIINIENGDALDPGADTFGDILKEIETLKLLGSSGAKNVNTVVDALLVGYTMWMVTEYCAGGSVSTLMKPRGRLPEQWIIPILREVAEAIFWVHKQGIIHRDIKCANVLVAESGAVQLCDFGVAGIIQTNLDKRSTVTGSLHWMAPELFNSTVRYGTEVDIWAFGSMAFEVASGLPPNATFRDIPRFGAYLRNNCPRLEGDHYSPGLKDLIARCMVEDPSQRPPIEQLQQHHYICGTEIDYPTESLSKLVHAYKLWEAQGGSRTSLFSAAGAQRQPTSDTPSHATDEWNFSTLDNLGQLADSDSLQPMFEAYNTDLNAQTQPSKPVPRRRRPPPPNIKTLVAPLEKLFDPNTITNYQDNSRDFYALSRGMVTSGLPLRQDSDAHSIRESLIDLDVALGDVALQSSDSTTVKPLARSLSSDPTDSNRRRTLDWTFPAEASVLSRGGMASELPLREDTVAQNIRESLIDLDAALGDLPLQHSRLATVRPLTRSRSSDLTDEDRRRTLDWTFPTEVSASSPPPFQHDSDPISNDVELTLTQARRDLVVESPSVKMAPPSRASALSLIDLDASLPGDLREISRPSTADSDTRSDIWRTPFDLERHAFKPMSQSSAAREPSLYIDDGDFGISTVMDVQESSRSLTHGAHQTITSPQYLPAVDSEHSGPPEIPGWSTHVRRDQSSAVQLPVVPDPPMAGVMLGTESGETVKDELLRLISSLRDHLGSTNELLETLPACDGYSAQTPPHSTER
ncbi:hypothetical protein HIM_11309 [Hirsutella minnesotensis 3608]|uniref:non-specific serine/threonine protein kinase n=1 Tax=Hirsutella minnesotensis 3608 TaxID=1043627 RepID=A0A0F7ZFK4_9HYPO|nr:hypothetical protein HIM_11309 [Hirsutella minnesotensis 3608]